MENREEHAASGITEGVHSSHDMQSRPALDEMSGMMGDLDMSGMDMTMHHSMHAVSHQSASMPDMPLMMHGSIMDDLACGYCVMLIHLPLMLWIFVAIIWLAFRIATAPPPKLVLNSFTVYFPGIAQPRAPPAY